MKESTRHRLAFDLYVRLGAARSLERLHEELTADPGLIELNSAPSRSTLDAWSATFHWQDRLRDLENEAANRDREEQVRALHDMNERHVKEGLALQQKGVERLKTLDEDEMSASDAIRSVIEGVKLERLSRGAPTERVAQEGTGDDRLRDFTGEELRQLADVAGRRAAGAGEAEQE